MLKDRTLLCISCSICPNIYVNKHLSRLTYGRVRAKGSNYVVARNRRIFNDRIENATILHNIDVRI